MLEINRRILVALAALIGCLLLATPRMGNSSPYGHVTEMHLAASPNDWHGRCPVTINFKGFIAVDGPNTVIYGINRSDGAKGLGQQRLRFTAAGRQHVHFTWRLGRPGENYNGWAEIGSGNMRSNRAEFQIHCR
jgi:hypothetical protein